MKQSCDLLPGVSMMVKQGPLPNHLPTFQEMSRVCDLVSSPTLLSAEAATAALELTVQQQIHM